MNIWLSYTDILGPRNEEAYFSQLQALLLITYVQCWTRKQLLTDTLFRVVRITPISRIACTSVTAISVYATMSASSVIIVTFIAVSWFCTWSVAVAAAIGRRRIVAVSSHGFVTTRTIGRVPPTPRSPPSMSWWWPWMSIGWRWRRWRVRQKGNNNVEPNTTTTTTTTTTNNNRE